MHRSSVLLAAAVSVSLSLLMAAAPAVGIITAPGAFLLDNTSVAGNATLFEGNHIETGAAPSQLQLDNGSRAQLGPESKGVVYSDRLVLERGSGRFENYGAEALSLRIQPEGRQTTAEVSVRKASLAGPGVVLVAALNGPVRVTNAHGVVLANVEAGRRLDFTPEAAASAAPTSVTGCLEAFSGKFLLTDEASLVRFEVRGSGLAGQVGHRVRIAGSVSPISDSVSRVQTSSVTRLSKKCSAGATGAAAAGVGAARTGTGTKGAAGTGAAGAGSPGASAPTVAGTAIATKAIIAGVIVAGAATAAAVGVVKAQDDPPSISPSTR